jgi:hypothetical protein
MFKRSFGSSSLANLLKAEPGKLVSCLGIAESGSGCEDRSQIDRLVQKLDRYTSNGLLSRSTYHIYELQTIYRSIDDDRDLDPELMKMLHKAAASVSKRLLRASSYICARSKY